jgi:hypothetical protein
MERICSSARAKYRFWVVGLLVKKMKIRMTLVAIALVGLITGIAFAGPLVLSELDVKKWTHHVQGETVDFEVEPLFANFTVVNPEADVIDMRVNFQVWVNITNPSELGANLSRLDFSAGETITGFSGYPVIGGNSSGGSGFEAEGAFVDGKWYNLTWTNGTYPFFDRDGNMQPSPFQTTNRTAYWMEGVQLYQRHVNGTVVAVYMNMNGTWTEVTGRVEVEEPEPSQGVMVENCIASQSRFPERLLGSFPIEGDDSDELEFGMTDICGEGSFDECWEPGESRIILLEGVRGFGSWVELKNFNPIDLLESGSVNSRTLTLNYLDTDVWMVNGTVLDIWSTTEEIKPLELTKVGNSYVYNMDLLEEYTFTVDDWNEVFLELR